jgi:hypothetical protein
MFTSDRRFPNLTRVPDSLRWFASAIERRVSGLHTALDQWSGELFFFYGNDPSVGVYRQRVRGDDGSFHGRSTLDEQVDGIVQIIQLGRMEWSKKQYILERRERDAKYEAEKKGESKRESLSHDAKDYVKHLAKKKQMGKRFKGIATNPGVNHAS